jgi:hypothetical protein
VELVWVAQPGRAHLNVSHRRCASHSISTSLYWNASQGRSTMVRVSAGAAASTRAESEIYIHGRFLDCEMEGEAKSAIGK